MDILTPDKGFSVSVMKLLFVGDILVHMALFSIPGLRDTSKIKSVKKEKRKKQYLLVTDAGNLRILQHDK